MLTLFTTAKPFKGHNAVVQRNALQSWKLLSADVEIMVLGDEEGSAEVCAELGLRHEPRLERTGFGAIRLDDIFGKAQSLACNDSVSYVNCDIVLMSDFLKVVQRVTAVAERFLLIGKRWDIDVTDRLKFGPYWEDELRTRVFQRGKRRRFEVDYLVFSKGLFGEIPPFGLGRLYWDHWLVKRAVETKAVIIDASYVITAVHQNHDYNHHPQGRAGVWEGDDAKRNLLLMGGSKRPWSFENATHVITPWGFMLATPLRRQAHALRRWTAEKMFNLFVHKTLPIRKVLGLRRGAFHKASQRE